MQACVHSYGRSLDAGHLERRVPFAVVGDVGVDRQHQVEEAAEEEVAVGADGIALQSPGLDAVRRPARAVVLAPACAGTARPSTAPDTPALGVVADLRQPVDGGPERGVPAQEIVEDARVHLAPGRGDVGHHRQRVADSWRSKRGKLVIGAAGAVPPGVRLAVLGPVVRRGGLAPQYAASLARDRRARASCPPQGVERKPGVSIRRASAVRLWQCGS